MFMKGTALVPKSTFCSGSGVNIDVGDIVVMKKNHPCGNNEFDVLRVGMDFKIRCRKCGHEVMVPRSKAEKNIRKIIKEQGEKNA